MRIELKKDIKIETYNIIADIESYNKKSPYFGLLSDVHSKEDLERSLESRGLDDVVIKNMIRKFKTLGLIEKDGSINIAAGYPNKEHGKFQLKEMLNDTILPFKRKNYSVKHKNAEGFYQPVEISKIIKSVSLYKKSLDFTNGESFRIEKLYSNIRTKDKKTGTKELSIILDNNKWFLKVNSIKEKCEPIEENTLFEGKWVYEDWALEIPFNNGSLNKQNKREFNCSYNKSVNIEGYGKLNGSFKNIKIVPTKGSAHDWFNFLLKDEIEKSESFLSQGELEFIWNNRYDYALSFSSRFNEKYDFKTISELFNRSSKAYWYTVAAEDLNPFEEVNFTGKKRSIHIIKDSRSKDFNVVKDNLDSLLENRHELIIVDRYVNTMRHTRILELIKKLYPELKMIVYTTDVYKNKDREAINKAVKSKNIMVKRFKWDDIPHDRHWIIDSEYWKATKSLDFIKIINKEYETEDALFTNLESGEVDNTVKGLIGKNNE